MRRRLFLIVSMIGVIWGAAATEDSTSVRLRVFIEGAVADFDYLRNNVTFVDFVNDPHSCDVHIIVTRKSTGSGGNHYYITFNSVTIKTVDDLALNCITTYQDTQDDVRNKFTRSVKSGLLIFINEKQLFYKINIVDENPQNVSYQAKSTLDPWNNWVFNIGLNGGLEAEEQKTKFNYKTTLSADRITNVWKVRNDYRYARQERSITKTEDSVETVIHASNLEQRLRTRLVYSLNPHWSAGAFIKGYQTTYRNIEYNAEVSAAIEYNIFSWEQVNQRVFTIAYYIGPRYFDYYKPTILGETSELRWAENVGISLEKIETWGKLEANIVVSHYFPDFKFYSVKTEAEFSVRVLKGLFLTFDIEAEKIKDQIYLQATELSDEELLLNVRKLPTSFELSAGIGIRYQFGSIFNNVVNQRL